MIAIDLAAAAILSLAIYYRRHRRRDLVVAFLGVNVGVLAVTTVLGSSEVAVGLGLGLFGVLSIIRLRSSEISQREVAYYFAALAIGLVAGLPTTDLLLPSALIVLVLAVMWVADHPALLGRSRHQTVHVDRAIADEDELRTELEERLGATVTSLTIQHLDLVDDTTLVDVRYRLARATAPRSASSAPASSIAAPPHPAPSPTEGERIVTGGAR
jgi:Ca2+/Na+ antiporter